MVRKKRPHKTSPKTPSRVKKRRGKKAKTRAHHHPELVGLGLAGLGVFLAAILWFGFSGGPGPHLAKDPIRAAARPTPPFLLPPAGLLITTSAPIDVRPLRPRLRVPPPR